MKQKLLAQDASERTFILILEEGDEAFSAISAFAAQAGIAGASVTAIGAFSSATVGFFRVESRDYRKIPVAEQSEVLSAIGDIARDEAGRPSLHLHAVLGLEDGSDPWRAPSRRSRPSDPGGHHPRKPDWIAPAQATGTRDSAHRPRRRMRLSFSRSNSGCACFWPARAGDLTAIEGARNRSVPRKPCRRSPDCGSDLFLGPHIVSGRTGPIFTRAASRLTNNGPSDRSAGPRYRRSGPQCARSFANANRAGWFLQ